MINLRKDADTQTLHSALCTTISAIVSKAAEGFTPDRIKAIVKNTYGANTLIANEDIVVKKITQAIEQVITNSSAESRLFRKFGTPFTCVIPNEYKELPGSENSQDSLVSGDECLVAFLENKSGDVQYADAVDFLTKTEALFPGAQFLHYLNQFHTDKISPLQCLYVLDQQQGDTMHQLFGGKVTQISTKHGIGDSDVLVLVTKI